MKNLKILTLLFCLISLSVKAQDYDLNLVTTQNDRVVGGSYKVMVQIRATPTKSSFNAGLFSLGLGFNTSSLSMPTVTGNQIDPANYTWQVPFDAHYQLGIVNLAGSSLNAVAFGRTGFTTLPAQPLPISTSWMDMIELEFEIISVNDKLGFNLLGEGYTGSPQQFDEIVGSSGQAISQRDGYTSIIYDGTNWLGGNGVSQAPDATDGCKDIVVQSGTAALTGNVETDYITVSSGAQLVIGPNATLRPFTQSASNGYSVPTADEFLIDADATGYGQYIGPGLPGTIRQWVGSDAGWRNMAFPVSSGNAFNVGGNGGNFNSTSTSYNSTPDCSGSWGNYINTVNVYKFNEGPQAHEWYGAASAPTGGTGGFNIFAGTPFGTSGVASIKGTFLDPSSVGTYSYSHTAPHVTSGSGSQSNVIQGSGCMTEPVEDRQANWNGWALVANPFPCNLDVAEFAFDNGMSTNQVRIWSRANNRYVESDNATIGFTTIAPMQAFWVKLGTAGSSQNLVFEDDQRVFTIANFLKYSGNQISLSATNTASLELAQIHLQFNSAASKGYDQLYDSYSYSQPGITAPQLTFHNTYLSNNSTVVAPLDHNTVPDVQTSDSYQLRFWSRTAGQFTFTVDTSSMLPSWNVYIEDNKLAPDVYVNITHNGYTFNYDPSIDDPERFVMYFSPSEGLNIDEDDVDTESSRSKARVFSDGDGIRVDFDDYQYDKVGIQIFNSAGQLLVDDKGVNTNEIYLYRTNEPILGFYLVNIINPDGSTQSDKVTR